MKKNKATLIAFLTFIFTNMTGFIIAQTGEPWTTKDLMEPETLAIILSDPKSTKPVIYNIGPLANLKGATTIGSTAKKSSLDKLSKALESVPQNKMIVIYCGCCPFKNCPNIRPAFTLLKERGYKNIKLLNLRQNLKVDWTDYGYPME